MKKLTEKEIENIILLFCLAIIFLFIVNTVWIVYLNSLTFKERNDYYLDRYCWRVNIDNISVLKVTCHGDCGKYEYCLDRRNMDMTFDECIEIVYECKHGQN